MFAYLVTFSLMSESTLPYKVRQNRVIIKDRSWFGSDDTS